MAILIALSKNFGNYIIKLRSLNCVSFKSSAYEQLFNLYNGNTPVKSGIQPASGTSHHAISLVLFVFADLSQGDLTTHPKCRAPRSQPARDLGSHVVRSAGFGRQGLATNRGSTLDPTDTQNFSCHGTTSSPCLHHVINYPQLQSYFSSFCSPAVFFHCVSLWPTRESASSFKFVECYSMLYHISYVVLLYNYIVVVYSHYI